jgi:Arf-GAP/SH3 domain/ANK repeat/PH domain-containing protein
MNAPIESTINGLTFMHAATPRDLDNLVMRELHNDPNMHKNNPNVNLVGDYSTNGSQSVQFTWSWQWKPPRAAEERGRGWRNCCSFVEYDQRNHRLDPLASFQFWVNNARPSSSQRSPMRLEPGSTVRLRVPSAQSMDSRISDSDDGSFPSREGQPGIQSYETIPEDAISLEQQISGTTAATVKLDINCQRPGEDVTMVDDGPLFRATMKAMELKTGNMRTRWKKVLKRAETAYDAQLIRNDAIDELTEALREAAGSNAHAVQPAMEHYFDKIAKEILKNDRKTTLQLQKLIIDPISKLYNNDIKQAEVKKRDFDEESKEYYAFVSRYLGQRQDSLKEKKRNETDTKYQTRRTRFELKRFDYSSYLQDLHGGRKDQEVLSSLTKFADAQAKGYLETSRTIESLLPQLEALNSEVKEADTAFKMHRTEREEKRRALEKSVPSTQSSEGAPLSAMASNGSQSLAQKQADLNKSGLSVPGRSQSQSMPTTNKIFGSMSSVSPAQSGGLSSSPSNKFKGIRDLEERDYSAIDEAGGAGVVRKEGLIWALSRPGTHIDPRGLNKQAWHK